MTGGQNYPRVAIKYEFPSPQMEQWIRWIDLFQSGCYLRYCLGMKESL